MREARLLSKLGDAAICQIYELVETPEADYLVLEYVRGRTLREAAANLSLEEKLALMAKVARALAVAHRAGIVHRDLKSDNLMVTPEGEIKILDFGVARSVDAFAEEDSCRHAQAALDRASLSSPSLALGYGA